MFLETFPFLHCAMWSPHPHLPPPTTTKKVKSAIYHRLGKFSWIQKRIQCIPAQYSYDLTVNSFGKAFAHVRNCLLMKKAHGTNRILEVNKNIDGLCTKTAQKRGFSKLCVKIKKRFYSNLFHFSTRKHNLVSFFGRIIF